MLRLKVELAFPHSLLPVAVEAVPLESEADTVAEYQDSIACECALQSLPCLCQQNSLGDFLRRTEPFSASFATVVSPGNHL